MTNQEQAEILVEAFKKLKHETRLWARAGDKDAANSLLKQMAAENLLLKSLGYMLGDGGRLVKYKSPTGAEAEQVYWALEAAKGNTQAAERLLNLMSKSSLDER